MDNWRGKRKDFTRDTFTGKSYNITGTCLVCLIVMQTSVIYFFTNVLERNVMHRLLITFLNKYENMLTIYPSYCAVMKVSRYHSHMLYFGSFSIVGNHYLENNMNFTI